MQFLSWLITGPFIYIAVLIFVTVTAYKVIGYVNMPRHLRWDLYPVPHQGPAGSKYQKVDYNKMPAFVSAFHEMKAMSQEMLFIKKAFDHNPKLWMGTFPLHIGLYLCALWLTCLTLGAGLEAAHITDFEAADSIFVMAMKYFTLSSGVLGLMAGLVGSLILIWQRYTEEDLRRMSDFVCYLNLYLMVFLFGSGFAAWATADLNFEIIRRHIVSLLQFRPSIVNETAIVAEFLAVGIFLTVLPFSRMMHFAVKYFFYHNIMWDDEMMKPGSKMEREVCKYLNYQVDWSASHVVQQATWNEQVSPAQGKGGLQTDEKTG